METWIIFFNLAEVEFIFISGIKFIRLAKCESTMLHPSLSYNWLEVQHNEII